MKHLDLGCGANPRNPFNAPFLYGIDIKKRDSIDPKLFTFKAANLTLEPIPFDDNYFDSISAFDFIEHIPRLISVENKTIFPFVNLINEVFRVLKPGGEFYAITPVFPKKSVFVDPTHVNFITSDTYKYFTEPYNWASMYGFSGSFIKKRVEVVNFALEEHHSKTIKSQVKKILFCIVPRFKQHIVWHLIANK